MPKYTRVRSCDDCGSFIPFKNMVERKLSKTESEYVCRDREHCAENKKYPT